MRIKQIKFKVSTSKDWQCHKCQKKIKGQDGFIEQLFTIKAGWGSFSENTKIRICWNCFKEFLGECSLDRKLRKEKYRGLEKKAIIRNLER